MKELKKKIPPSESRQRLYPEKRGTGAQDHEKTGLIDRQVKHFYV